MRVINKSDLKNLNKIEPLIGFKVVLMAILRCGAALICACALAGCGYESLASASSKILGERINASGQISAASLDSHIVILDEFYEYLQNSLGKTLDSSAPTSIKMSVKSSTFTPLYYDEFGYSRSFLAKVVLEFLITLPDQRERVISASGHYAFNSNAISTLSEDEKSMAMIKASRSAFAEFATKLGVLQ